MNLDTYEVAALLELATLSTIEDVEALEYLQKLDAEDFSAELEDTTIEGDSL